MKMKHIKTEAAPVSGQHSPLPWAVANHGQTIVQDTGNDNDYILIAKVLSQEGRDDTTTFANAEFIVRAANCHGELMRALQLCYTWAKEQFAAEMNKDDNEDNQTLMRDVCEQARAALDKATR